MTTNEGTPEMPELDRDSCGWATGESASALEAHARDLTARLAKMQEILDIITTPNVSYFDMTPAEEIARLEARLQQAEAERERLRKALKNILKAEGADEHCISPECEICKFYAEARAELGGE